MGNIRKDLGLGLGREALTPLKPKPGKKPHQSPSSSNAASSSKKGVNVSPGSAAASASIAAVTTPGRSKTVRRYQPERSQSPKIAEAPAISLDVKAALKEFEDPIARYSSSVGRFVESHLNNAGEIDHGKRPLSNNDDEDDYADGNGYKRQKTSRLDWGVEMGPRIMDMNNHLGELIDMKYRFQASNDAKVQRLQANYNAEVQYLQASNDAEVKRLQASRDAEIRYIQASYDSQVQRLKNTHDGLVQGVKNNVDITAALTDKMYEQGRLLFSTMYKTTQGLYERVSNTENSGGNEVVDGEMGNETDGYVRSGLED
jgi:hypothetical protein